MSSSISKRLSEVDLKCLYLEHLRRLGLIDANSVIASEYSLGQTGRRVDLAILSDEFIGVEIKSKSDSLKRLQPQLSAYVGCFDRVVLVADERHIASAQTLMPASVELWTVDGAGSFALVQKPITKGEQSARVLAQLCTIRQLRGLASAEEPNALSRSKLIDAAVQLPFDSIHKAALAAFRGAFNRSSMGFWNDLESQEIDSNALAALSRFADARRKKVIALKKQKDFWSAWAEEAAVVFGSPQSSVVAAS
jgi:hypothetical protein